VVADPARDLAKIAVVERHLGTGRIGLGLVRGFGLRSGALASTVAHDAHNIVVVGVDDHDMSRAVARLDGSGHTRAAREAGPQRRDAAIADRARRGKRDLAAVRRVPEPPVAAGSTPPSPRRAPDAGPGRRAPPGATSPPDARHVYWTESGPVLP
jgi:hypothetical protein